MSFKSPLKAIAPRAYYRGSREGSNVVTHRPRSRKKAVWGSIFFVISMIGLTTYLGYLVFNGKGRSYTGERVSLEITGQGSVKRGQEAVYVIRYKNGEDVELAGVSLTLFTSGNFKPIKAEPEASSASLKVWRFDKLKPRESGAVEIRGLFTKDAAPKEFLEASLQYQPENFSSKFSSKARVETDVSGPLVDLKVSGPEVVTQSQKAEYVIEYENKGDDLKRVGLKIFLPSFFSNASFEPAPASGRLWYFDLDRGETGKISLKTEINAQTKTSEQIKAVVSGAPNEIGVAITEAVLNVRVARPELSVSLSGSAGNAKLKYENSGDIALEGVMLTVKVDEDQDVDSVITDEGERQLEGGVVFWELDEIEPKASGEIGFRIIPAKGHKDAIFRLTPRASGKVLGIAEPFIFNGQPFTFSIK